MMAPVFILDGKGCKNPKRRIIYQRGPRGGGISIAVKPLMHWVAAPSPTFRIYCTTEMKGGNQISFLKIQRV